MAPALTRHRVALLALAIAIVVVGAALVMVRNHGEPGRRVTAAPVQRLDAGHSGIEVDASTSSTSAPPDVTAVTSPPKPTTRPKATSVPAPSAVPAGVHVERRGHQGSGSGLDSVRYDFTNRRTISELKDFEMIFVSTYSLAADRVAYDLCENPPQNCSVRIAKSDGTPVAKIDNARTPAWSPDGRWLVMHRWGTEATGPLDGLLVVSADGGNNRVVGHGTRGDLVTPAVWSPDSSRLAVTVGVDSETNEDELHVVSRDGTNDKVLPDPLRTTHVMAGSFLPEWSRDGTRLLYHRYGRAKTESEETMNSYLAVVEVAAGTWQELGGWYPIGWSHDGRAVFAREHPGHTSTGFYDQHPGPSSPNITRISLQDGTRTTVARDASFSISPDGRLAALGTAETLRVVSLDGGGVDTVLFRRESAGSEVLWGEWTPDGTALYIEHNGARITIRVDGRGSWRAPLA